MAKANFKRGAANAWIDTVNPMRGMTIAYAQQIYDCARSHGSPLLQRIFDEIERTDPVLMTCVERRDSALATLGWRVTAAPGADEALAQIQKDALERFIRNIDNLPEAIGHLDSAFFRGHAFVQPVWKTETSVPHINLLKSWHFLQDDEGAWLWNPECSVNPADCDSLDGTRVVSVTRKRYIDYPALFIYLRKFLGERDWGRFIERYGIPPVDVVMAPNATNDQKADYVEAADRARDGLSTVWPSGSSTSRAEGSRGQDPFTAFIEHQEKLIVLLATGGTLTSLAQADTGSLAGGAQMDVWHEIVQRDAVLIASALNRQLFTPFLETMFPGQTPLVSFEIGQDDRLTQKEAAELAALVKQSGYIVDQSELERAVGMRLEKDTAGVAIPGTGFKRRSIAKEASQEPSSEGLLEAYANDMNPAAERVKAFLASPSAEAAQKLIEDLPQLLPDDPEMAALIADAMAKEFQHE